MTVNRGPEASYEAFLWHPGRGPDRDALGRLALAFPRPATPMGEAWFMGGERRMFPELLRPRESLQIETIFEALEELASGPVSFGPMEEWTEWCHYLLPRLMPRMHETTLWASLLELVVTAVLAQHPHSDAPEPYAGFRADVLLTLGRCLMAPECWTGERVDLESGLNKNFYPHPARWFWDSASGKLSCSLFLCLKYLPPAAVASWLTSVLEIKSHHWRAQVLVWAVGAFPFLTGELNQPGEAPEDANPDVSWWSSHFLKGTYTGDYSGRFSDAVFLPEPNRRAASSTIRGYFADRPLAEWSRAFQSDAVLIRELGDLPARFSKLYCSEPP